MQTRAEYPRPALVFADEECDLVVPPLWKDIALSLALAVLLGLAFLI